jgi:hypothetical protein
MFTSLPHTNIKSKAHTNRFFGEQPQSFFAPAAKGVMRKEDNALTAEDLCLGVQHGPGTGPQRQPFTAAQQRRVTMGRYAALSMISRSLMALSSGDEYMLRIARNIFGAGAPGTAALISTITTIRDRLRDATITRGTCHDDNCYAAGVVAHAVPADNEIVLCNRLFATGISRLIRTLIHEAAHNAGIDATRVAANLDENYCNEEYGLPSSRRCNNISDAVNNVDAWAWFIEYAAYSY